MPFFRGSLTEGQANKAQRNAKTAIAELNGVPGIVDVNPATGKMVPGTWRRGDIDDANVNMPARTRMPGGFQKEPPMYSPQEAAKLGTDVYGRPLIDPREPPMFPGGTAPAGANVYGQRLPAGHKQDPVYDEAGNLRAPKNALAQIEDTTPEPFTDPVAKRSYQQEVYNQAQQMGAFNPQGGPPQLGYDAQTGMMINRSMYGNIGPNTPNRLMQQYFGLGSNLGQAPMLNEGASAAAAAQNMARQELDSALGNISQQEAALNPNESMFRDTRPGERTQAFPAEFEALPDEMKAEYLQRLQSFSPAY